MNLKNKKEDLNITRVNEVLRLSQKILKIVFILISVLLVFTVILLAKSLNIIPIVLDILKVIMPLFIGMIIAWLFDPFVTKLNKKGVNRVLGTFFVYFVFIGGLLLVGKLIVPSLTEQINDIASSVPSWVNNTKSGIDGFFDSLSKTSGYDLEPTKLQMFEYLNVFGSDLATKLPTMTVDIISSIINGGVTLIFGLIIGFYMLFDFGSVRRHFIALVPEKNQADAINFLDRLNTILRSFVQGTLTIAFILFVFQSVGLSIAGMKAPLVFGIFCAITNIIPYVGPWIGGIPVIIIAFTTGPMVGLLATVSVVLAQSLESYFLQPIVMGKTMKLHPVTIMIGLLLFGTYFGIVGMILATPIISTIKLVVQFLDEKYNFLGKINHDNVNKFNI